MTQYTQQEQPQMIIIGRLTPQEHEQRLINAYDDATLRVLADTSELGHYLLSLRAMTSSASSMKQQHKNRVDASILVERAQDLLCQAQSLINPDAPLLSEEEMKALEQQLNS